MERHGRRSREVRRGEFSMAAILQLHKGTLRGETFPVLFSINERFNHRRPWEGCQGSSESDKIVLTKLPRLRILRYIKKNLINDDKPCRYRAVESPEAALLLPAI